MLDPHNPNNPVAIENQEIQETVITSPDGTVTRIRRLTDVVMVDGNGTRTFQGLQHVLRSIDGKNLTDPVQALRCTTCLREPLSQGAVVVCSSCQTTTCIAHCRSFWRGQAVCRRCWWRQLWRYVWTLQ